MGAENYRYEFVAHEMFMPIFKQHQAALFADHHAVDLLALHSDEENNRCAELARQQTGAVRLCVVAYDGDDVIGWSFGDQKSGDCFHMRNSAVYPAYRRKGVYSKLLHMLMDKAVETGFQQITSRHHATNNPVLIAKMKAGFMISGMEISDKFGIMVGLVYYPSEKRVNLLRYRVGQRKTID